jgi:hypothetical protein
LVSIKWSDRGLVPPGGQQRVPLPWLNIPGTAEGIADRQKLTLRTKEVSVERHRHITGQHQSSVSARQPISERRPPVPQQQLLTEHLLAHTMHADGPSHTAPSLPPRRMPTAGHAC